MGYGAICGKMLLVRIVENNKIDDYIGQVGLSKPYFTPPGLRKGLEYSSEGLEPSTGARNRKNNPSYYF